MDHLTFENANKLEWSNDLLDFVIAMSLLQELFEERPEALVFRSSRIELRQEYLPVFTEIYEKTSTLRRSLRMNMFGVSRGRSTRIFSNVVAVASPVDIYDLAVSSAPYMPEAEEFCKDKDVIDVFEKFEEFREKYNERYSQKALGSILPLKRLSDSVNDSLVPEVRNRFYEIVQPHVESILRYLRKSIHLHYRAGLKCWWAPLFQINLDMVEASRPFANVKRPRATIDGVLGTLFSGQIKRLYSDSSVPREKKRVYREYFLASMRRQDTREKLGADDYKNFCETMSQWGYRRSMHWDRATFDCLFDRIFLGDSVIAAAQREGIGESAAQENTARIAKILSITLPRSGRVMR
ncbi:hypothetical protein Dform_01453 [Dehalogenimonas formicexedens]|uniref:Uncharacterized protein n=2 Tax=Dehalogenimonas TaxID=670486 RepID=A0A1P8F8J9_9CHLR|nr:MULTISPECIES: hypothetical protein [Dehalogenimonas]APV44775.1 hypothetical protein Dform_01453 [Dehalogenimonas formicexedens]KTB48863.1 hypothetical protein DEALK_17100 [Dehalogenimonas alkenigignens]